MKAKKVIGRCLVVLTTLRERNLLERNLLERVIIGTFKNEVASYITANYPDAHRSACPDEVTKFYFSAMLGKKDFSCSYDVLQLPFGNAKMSHGFNLGTAKLINYAHAHNLAVQYWTINEEKDLKYLIDMGADSLMSDYPDRVEEILSGQR